MGKTNPTRRECLVAYFESKGNEFQCHSPYGNRSRYIDYIHSTGRVYRIGKSGALRVSISGRKTETRSLTGTLFHQRLLEEGKALIQAS